MKFWKFPKKKYQQKELSVLTILFAAAFLALIVYLVIFLGFESEGFINNPYNKRIDALSEKTIRGSIYANDGTVLAYSTNDETTNEEHRSYPYANLYAHVVGFPVNGKMGVESASNFELLHSHSNVVERLKHAFTGEECRRRNRDDAGSDGAECSIPGAGRLSRRDRCPGGFHGTDSFDGEQTGL